MKIAIADNTGLKFLTDLKQHWEDQGHEVRYERGASEYLAQWADLYYVEWIDGNLNYLWKLYNGADDVSRTPDWGNNKKPIIACRLIDWDIWNPYVPFYEEQYINFIDKAICIAPHIQKRILDRAPQYNGKLQLIRPGVAVDKFPLKTTKTDGHQIGMVLGDMWWPKNHMSGLDIFTQLYRKDNRWRLHIRGQHEGGTEYWRAMYEHYLDSRGIREAVTLYAPVDSMDTWYEGIDYLLHPGMKEAFSYAVAEAACKGIPIICNEFMGALDIWPEDWLYQTTNEAVHMFQFTHDPQAFRDYVVENYNLQKYFQETDSWLGVK